MFTLSGNRACAGTSVVAVLIGLAACTEVHAGEASPAIWFPDAPSFRHYHWDSRPCPGCKPLNAQPAWTRMARLAGLAKIRFLAAPDESTGEAYSAAPDMVVLSPSALKRDPCQLAFVIGHEIVHIAQRHFDEDAIALSIFSGKAAQWTQQGEDAIELLDGDFGLALRVAHLWQEQEQDADWMGALLAAQACGCSLGASALAYFQNDATGGGLAAAHASSQERREELLPFAESARRLAERHTP